MFVFLQHMFHFLHLQENLVYITCKDAISPDLIYYIMKGDSVFIRSIYQLNSNTLLVDLNVPTGELDYNLTSTLIEVCNKYFYTYHDDQYILETYLANSLFRGSQNHPGLFILSCGRLYARRKPINLVINFCSIIIILHLWKVCFIHLYNYWVITSWIDGRLCFF